MPLYEYRCQGCGRVFEVLQRMGAGSSGLACPACGSEALERALSTFAAATAGTGTAGSGVGGCAPRGAFT